MNLAPVRQHALALPQTTVPPEKTLIHVFVDEEARERALALYPACVEKRLWRGKAVGLRIALAQTQLAAVKALLAQVWANKAPKGLLRGG